MANDYAADAASLLAQVGGAANVAQVTHCMTRMRFVLRDAEAANVAAIEAISSVRGTFSQAGQFQVIIGNDVATFYEAFMVLPQMSQAATSQEADKPAAAADEAALAQKGPLQRAAGVLGEIFAPIIPAIICGGFVLGVANLLGEVACMPGGKTLIEAYPSLAWAYAMLMHISHAVFSLLPVGVCWSVTKKMGATQILGIVLGLVLVGGAATGAQVELLTSVSYEGQVIAPLLAAFVLCGLERLLRRLVPDAVSMIVVPLCSLVPTVAVTYAVLGPAGVAMGDALAQVAHAALSSWWGPAAAALVGGLYVPLVTTGLHHVTNVVDMQLVSAYGSTPLWPLFALSNIAQGAAVLGMAVLQRSDERARVVNLPAMLSCWMGVTEPALFGVNLKYRFPAACGMAGSALAGAVGTACGMRALSIGIGGVPGILSISFECWGAFALAMLIAVVVPFTLTVVVGRTFLNKM